MVKLIAKSVLITLAILTLFVNVYATPASPQPFDAIQSDGTAIKIKGYGDEYFNWYEDMQGNVVEYNFKSSDWCYAYISEGKLLPTSVPVNSKLKVKSLERKDLTPLIENIDRSSLEQTAKINYPPYSPFTPDVLNDLDESREPKQDLLVLLIEFKDVKLTKDINYWKQHYFNSQIKSVNGYYEEVSKGKQSFNPVLFATKAKTFEDQNGNIIQLEDGVAKVTLNQNHHGINNRTAITNEIKEAFNIAKDYIDFSVYENYYGYIKQEELSVSTVIAGWEESNSANASKSNTTWAFARRVVAGNSMVTVRLEDSEQSEQHRVELLSFATQGEIYSGNELNDKAQPMGVGVTVHELGHVLGLPDLYDYGMDSEGIGAYSLMGSGNWGKAENDTIPGQTPVHLDAWSKIALGFVEPTTIKGDSEIFNDYILNSFDAENYNVLKVTSSADENQYFLLENRQKTGYDEGLFNHTENSGILIYHVDEKVPTTLMKSFVNDNKYHKYIDVEEANGSSQLDSVIWGRYSNHFFSETQNTFSESTTLNSNFYIQTEGTHEAIAGIDDRECHLQEIKSGINLFIKSPSQQSMSITIGLSNFSYKINDDDETVSITKYNGNDEVVIIPSKIDGKNITVIEDGAFLGCDNLQGVKVFEDNLNYSSEDGVLYNKDKTALVKFPQAKETAQFAILESITEIGSNAFYGCSGLNSLEIPKNVVSIGENAFANCPNLKIYCYENSYAHEYAKANEVPYEVIYEVNLNDWEYTINENSVTINNYIGQSLKTIVPDEIDGKPVTIIGSFAFANNINLVSIEIPECITVIEESAFFGCENLIDVNIPQNVIEISSQLFENCLSLETIVIPESITSIGSRAFANCKSLLSIPIPENVTIIEEGAFFSCEKLTNVNIPEGITEISFQLFENCLSLEAIVIPESVTSIGSRAFANCKSLSSVEIPESVTIIKSGAFFTCENLIFIELPEQLEQIENSAFLNCFKLSSIVIPQRVTTIDSKTFSGCKKLTSIQIPENVDYIGSFAFESCASLTSIKLPSKLTSIGIAAFAQCGLTSIEIPEGVTYIDRSAFAECANLALATIPKSVEVISDGTFAQCPNLTIRCYKNSLGFKYAQAMEIAYELIDSGTLGNWEYSINEEAIVIDKYNGADNEVIVPSEINQKPVKSISAEAFKSNSSIASVKIPDSLISIENSAFEDCSNLILIEIPSSVTTFGEDIFKGCSSNLKIIGEAGSEAENYAVSNGISFEAKAGVVITGEIKTQNSKTKATVVLKQNGEIKYSIEVISGIFKFENVASGTYTLEASKPVHTKFTLQDIVVYNEDIDLTQDEREEVKVMIIPCGDINGNGNINTEDLSILLSAKNFNKPTEEAENKLADLNGNGNINTEDLSMLLSKINFNMGSIIIKY